MPRYHLAFTNIHSSVIRATERLFDSSPWAGTDEEKHVKFEQWIKDAARAYGIKTVPALEVRYELGVRGLCGYTLNGNSVIIMRRYSVTTLFHEFRHIMQIEGVGGPDDRGQSAETDAVKWSTSLFYSVNPLAFRKAVRKGGIGGVYPEDLIHPDSPTSLCSNCEENVWEHDEEWRHIETGRLSCDTVEGQNPSMAEPIAGIISGASIEEGHEDG